MKYVEALKKVRSDKPKENFMLITAGYGNHILLPHKDGINFITALAQAEQLVNKYGEPERIIDFDKESISVRLLSSQEYERIKVAQLLGVSQNDIKEAEQLALAEGK